MIKRFASMIQTTVKAVTFEKKHECAFNDQIVNYERLEEPIHECGPSHLTQGYGWLGHQKNYVGVPAPAYLKDDEWFGPAPEYTDNQKDYMERETEIKRQEFEKSFSTEPENIHQVMYEIATSNWNTVDETKQSMGGSENFQEGWNSGTGMGQYR